MLGHQPAARFTRLGGEEVCTAASVEMSVVPTDRERTEEEQEAVHLGAPVEDDEKDAVVMMLARRDPLAEGSPRWRNANALAGVALFFGISALIAWSA